MILQHDRAASVGPHRRTTDVVGMALNGSVVLDQNAVEQHRDVGRNEHHAVLIEAGRGVHHVVGLPFAGLLGGVHQWHGLLVNTARLAIGVGAVVIAVEYLQFVEALHKHTAVAAPLAVALHLGGRAPLDVQLEIAKIALGLDATLAGGGDDGIFGNRPARRAAFDRLPLIEVATVEQHDGIRRGREARNRRRCGTGRDKAWLRVPDFAGFGRHFFGLELGLRRKGGREGQDSNKQSFHKKF